MNLKKKLQTFDSVYFRGRSHFEEDGTQNCLVFQPIYRYFKRVAGAGTGNYIYCCKSKDCLIKILQLLLQVIIASMHN